MTEHVDLRPSLDEGLGTRTLKEAFEDERHFGYGVGAIIGFCVASIFWMTLLVISSH
jgi:hypothetical protein